VMYGLRFMYHLDGFKFCLFFVDVFSFYLFTYTVQSVLYKNSVRTAL
jgi:hypothetical protein